MKGIGRRRMSPRRNRSIQAHLRHQPRLSPRRSRSIQAQLRTTMRFPASPRSPTADRTTQAGMRQAVDMLPWECCCHTTRTQFCSLPCRYVYGPSSQCHKDRNDSGRPLRCRGCPSLNLPALSSASATQSHAAKASTVPWRIQYQRAFGTNCQLDTSSCYPASNHRCSEGEDFARRLSALLLLLSRVWLPRGGSSVSALSSAVVCSVVLT